MNLDDKIKTIFEKNSEYYRNLNPEKKKIFDQRVVLYIEAKEWLYMGMQEEMPYDLKALVAFQPVRLTLQQKDFLLEPFDRIAVYPNPFLALNNLTDIMRVRYLKWMASHFFLLNI
ncbi:MAG: zinc-dependent peptidase [Saprospiraceae bacterium]|nr:zinc-dependent peptidase [Candidatus Brachybacter algidus]